MGIINNIRKKREEKGFSQDYMANMLSITSKTYARLENGQGKLIVKLIDEIAKVLEVSPYELFAFESEEFDNNSLMVNDADGLNQEEDRQDIILKLHREQIRHLQSEVVYLRHIIEKKLIQPE